MMAPEPLDSKTSEVSAENEEPAEKGTDRLTSEVSTENEQPAGNETSRFSEDDMDTEIEVTPEENPDEKPRRKKKKKSEEPGEDEKRETSEERRERKRKRRERKKAKEEKRREHENADPPPYTAHDDDVEEKKKKKKSRKENLKANMNNLLDAPFRLAAGIIVCVILPFSIYACDVILSVNVIDRETYHSTIISPKNNMSKLPPPEALVGETYRVQGSVLLAIQINSRPDNRQRRALTDEKPVIVEEASDPTPTAIIAATKAVETTDGITTPTTTSTTSSTIFTTTKKSNTTKAPEITLNATSVTNVTTPTTKSRNTIRKKKKDKIIPRKLSFFNISTKKTTTTMIPKMTTVNPEEWKQKDYEFCKGLYYFYELHISHANKTGSDWLQDESASVYQKEQTLFFMFTIIGFISLLIGLGLRCDVFLAQEWSSFLLVNLFLYSISMAVTVAVFAQESSNGGLRCAACRLTTYCHDIDPWDYHNHWPDENHVQWSMVALISFVLKLIDCYAIGIVTLTFIVDFKSDLWWISILKIVGWIFIFPMMIFTPMLGVARYIALPGVSPTDHVTLLAVEVLFYFGIVFWGIGLLALPFFCKWRMCSGSEEEERQEMEDEEYE